MKTYLLKNIEDVYQQITLDSIQLSESLNLGDGGLEDCVNLGLLDVKFSDRWKKVDTSFASLPDHPQAVKIPNISIWKNATLVLSEKAYANLKLILADYGEFLPINIDGFNYFIFNLLTSGKVDDSKSQYEWDGDVALGIEKLVFDESDIKEKAIFKSFHQGFGGIFCSDGFRSTCEELEIDGLIFEEDLSNIW
ncbi:hypothetical protein [Microbulbifer taiwanensis]|uniref:Uncharacterized protein n=1 Tax=Microbulbifer taiwanensis TaxID=986746 RepID=A0ABW1YL87_9GAMM|nr:hypothetical protein [Microbulbifer taiwanensis]